MADWRIFLLAFILVAGGCRQAKQPDGPSPPEQSQRAESNNHSIDTAKPQSEPTETHPKPQTQRLNPAFPYPDGYKPEIRLDPPPVPPEIIGPSPPIKRHKSGKNHSSPTEN